MKLLNLSSLLFLGLALPLAHANVPTPSVPPDSIQLAVSAVNVPAGFGEGTASAVSVEIPLRDSCYHYDRIERTDINATTHQFIVYGHLDRQGMCMEVFRYMQRDVILSNLQPGTHTLIFETVGAQPIQKQITVGKLAQ